MQPPAADTKHFQIGKGPAALPAWAQALQRKVADRFREDLSAKDWRNLQAGGRVRQDKCEFFLWISWRPEELLVVLARVHMRARARRRMALAHGYCFRG